MAREQMLLDRIAQLGAQGHDRFEATAAEDLDAVIHSVRRNLIRLLNARHGMSEAMPDYGLPALTDLTIGSRAYVERVKDAIKVAIDKYEPRLRNVRVSRSVEEEGAQRLGFRVEATLIAQSGEHRIWYETTVRGSGEFDVSE
ncbi:MAG: type VI secretion system baseplate subunit TssE [Phycisphaerae bacterium]